jgi:uroporphyrinogen-III synthase
MKKTIFISKSFQEIQLLVDHCEKKNVGLIAHSFLQFQAIPFEIDQEFQAVFFGSPRAIDFYLKRYSLSDSLFIGCIGEMTAKHLITHGFQPNFTGATPGEPNLVAEEFKQSVGNKIVFFPQSLISNRSICSAFDPSQVIEKSIYKTVVVTKQIAPCTHYVFTSPSNVDGFLAGNKLAPSSTVIAWGATTAQQIENQNIRVNHLLKTASLEELLTLIH